MRIFREWQKNLHHTQYKTEIVKKKNHLCNKVNQFNRMQRNIRAATCLQTNLQQSNPSQSYNVLQYSIQFTLLHMHSTYINTFNQPPQKTRKSYKICQHEVPQNLKPGHVVILQVYWVVEIYKKILPQTLWSWKVG